MPSVNDLAVMWLRHHAVELRALAIIQRTSAYSGVMRHACDYTATHYEKAAALLDDAATIAENDPEVIRHA